MTYCVYASPIGTLWLATRTGTTLCGLWIQGQKHFARGVSQPLVPGEAPVLTQTAQWLDAYFSGLRPNPAAIPLEPDGTAFQRLIRAQLLQIPYGETTTYGALARQAAAALGREQMSAQAVGGAVGRNPIAILVPCHRVVGADGSLTGYAGGLSKKSWLLSHERGEGPLPGLAPAD